jgi:ATP-binding cassette subfamily B protein
MRPAGSCVQSPQLGNGKNGHFLRWIFKEFGGARPWVALLAISVVGYALGHGAWALGAGLLGRALVEVGGQAGSTLRSSGRLFSTLLFGLLGSVVKGCAGSLLAAAEARLAGQVARSLYSRVLSNLLAEGAHDAQPRVLATIAVRVREIERAVVAGAVTGLRSFVQLVPLALTLILLSPRLFLAGGLLIVPFGWVLGRLRGRLSRSSDRAQRFAEDVHLGLHEVVCNVDLFRTYAAGDRVVRAVDETSVKAAGAMASLEAGRAALSGTNEVLGALALLGAFALGARLGVPVGDGTVVMFATVFFMAYRPVRDLGDARAWCIRGQRAKDALDAMLGCGRALVLSGDPREPASAEGSARFWGGGTGTLELCGLGALDRGPVTSLVMSPGELLALVGPTGSGKTTLLRVLLGLEPARGQVRYAGIELTGSGVGPALRPFAWVPQEAPLVSGTVLENVALVGVSEDQARRALAEIGAVSLLERARSERVGPGGRPLSGGERRQVALARALATGQPVLLLDEPTLGLDAEAAQAVLGALTRLRGRRAVMVVTHDPATASLCDRVLPLGTHPPRGRSEAKPD